MFSSLCQWKYKTVDETRTNVQGSLGVEKSSQAWEGSLKDSSSLVCSCGWNTSLTSGFRVRRSWLQGFFGAGANPLNRYQSELLVGDSFHVSSQYIRYTWGEKVEAKFLSETPGELHGALMVTKVAEWGWGRAPAPPYDFAILASFCVLFCFFLSLRHSPYSNWSYAESTLVWKRSRFWHLCRIHATAYWVGSSGFSTDYKLSHFRPLIFG